MNNVAGGVLMFIYAETNNDILISCEECGNLFIDGCKYTPVYYYVPFGIRKGCEGIFG